VVQSTCAAHHAPENYLFFFHILFTHDTSEFSRLLTSRILVSMRVVQSTRASLARIMRHEARWMRTASVRLMGISRRTTNRPARKLNLTCEILEILYFEKQGRKKGGGGQVGDEMEVTL
jgi:hypothetical protein